MFKATKRIKKNTLNVLKLQKQQQNTIKMLYFKMKLKLSLRIT